MGFIGDLFGGGPEPPKPPDPAKTAAAQAAANKETAIAQYGLGATNQITPYGTLSYKQIGTWPDGTPRFEATQALSPEQQQLYDLSTAGGAKMGGLANAQLDQLGGVLGQPVNLTNEAVEGRLFDLGRQRLDPMFEQQRQSLEQQLANKGISAGSEAYAREMQRFSQGTNDAYNQLLLSGRGQSVSEILAGRSQPLNELNALRTGSQVSPMGFAQTPQPGVGGTDVMGAYGQQYAGQMANYNAQMQQQSGMMNGLFGLGSAALGGWFG